MSKLVKILLLASALFFGQTQASLVIPKNTSLVKTKSDSGITKFKGKISLNGTLRAYWGRPLEFLDSDEEVNSNLKVVYIDFKPDSPSIGKLPYIDGYKPNKVDLNYSARTMKSSRQSEKLIKTIFKNIPNNFWRNQEGYLTISTTVLFDQYEIEKMCDRGYYSANLLKVDNRLKNQQYEFLSNDDEGCLGYMLGINYNVSSKDGFANFRKTPEIKGNILKRLPDGTSVIKINTSTDGNWYFVRLHNSNQTGYIHKSQLKILD